MVSDKEAGTAEHTEKPSVSTKLLGVAGYIANLPRGERAQLRRVRDGTHEIPPEVFWRIVERYEIRPGDERFWLQVVPLMVDHSHRSGARAGHALAGAGVAGARIERWLRLDRPSAWRESRRLLSRLDSGFDWKRFGTLLFFWTEQARLDFARDFFLAASRPSQDTDHKATGEN